jgi:hypothetical protein
MGENENSVSKQQSIQVRKVSQLNNYKEYLDNNKLSYTNSYFMVSYPSNNSNIPHNYKVSLNDIQQFSYDYIAPQLTYTITYYVNMVANDIRKEYDDKFNMLLSYISDVMNTSPDISAYWNTVGYFIKQYYGKDTIDPEDTLVTYIIDGKEYISSNQNF